MKDDSGVAIAGWIVIAVVVLAVVVLFGIWVVIPRDQADDAGRPALERDGEVLVDRYPGSGELETSTAWSRGIKRKEYFREGEPGALPLARDGLDRRIWGEHDVAIGDESDGQPIERHGAFFVGTRIEYGQARRPPSHVLPDVALPER